MMNKGALLYHVLLMSLDFMLKRCQEMDPGPDSALFHQFHMRKQARISWMKVTHMIIDSLLIENLSQIIKVGQNRY